MNPLPLPGFKSLRDHPLVWLIACLCLVPFVLIKVQGLASIDAWFIPSSVSGLFAPFSVWRIWTPIFVHYELAHLFTNVYLWWLFASKIEERSRLELCVVVLICGAVGNIAQWGFQGPDFGGLSGVVYGLMAYLWTQGRYGGKTEYHVDKSLVVVMLVLIPVSASGLIGKYANYAHVAGLLSGACLAWCVLIRESWERINSPEIKSNKPNKLNNSEKIESENRDA